MRSNIVFIVFLLSFSIDLFAQHTNIYLGNSYNLLYEKEFLIQDHHTSFKPLIKSVVNFKTDISLESESDSWFSRKLFSEHLVIIDAQDYYFTASPIINFELGKEQSSGRKFKNTRGFLLEGSIGERVSFQTSFMENQASFPNYIETYVKENLIIPGEGYKRDFKSNAFDYAMASGYVAIKPAESFIIQFGHGKHFIGDGYRSLLLSDISFNYPFLRIQTNIGRIQYTNLYTEFQDIRNPLSYESGFAKKYMSSHHLSYNITKQLNISLYEAVVWRINHAPGNNGFDFNYLNPIIFFRPVEYSINSPDNVLMGLNAKYQFLEEAYMYSQFVLDEFSLTSMRKGKNWWGNKYGYQLGAKSYNTLKIPNLTLQAEYNLVRPYTYAHHNPSQNYAHYNQPLAHPLGANFEEMMIIIHYKCNRLVSRLQLMDAKYGSDIEGDSISYGNDVYISTGDFEGATGRPGDYDIRMFQGVSNKLGFMQFNIGYIINPVTNLKFDLGYIYRNRKIDQHNFVTHFYFAGLSTDLFNRYYDF